MTFLIIFDASNTRRFFKSQRGLDLINIYRHMKRIVFIVVILFSGLVVYGQRDDSGNVKDALSNLKHYQHEGRGSISLDSLTESHYNKHIVFNRKNKGVAGYRIRIFSDNGPGAKDDQKRAKARFLSFFPEMHSYYRYEGSYYKIYIGDFRTKREALIFLDDVKEKFPDAFIVEDNIIVED